MREIKVGSIYKRFKNKYYIVLDIVNDCESNNEKEYRKIVIYKALYGEYLTWARDYEMFASLVDHNKYPEIKQKYRFEEVNDLKELKEYINNYNNELNNKISNLTCF